MYCPLSKKLLWIDITRGKLFIYNEDTGNNEHIDLRQAIGTVVPFKEKSCGCIA